MFKVYYFIASMILFEKAKKLNISHSNIIKTIVFFFYTIRNCYCCCSSKGYSKKKKCLLFVVKSDSLKFLFC